MACHVYAQLIIVDTRFSCIFPVDTSSLIVTVIIFLIAQKEEFLLILFIEIIDSLHSFSLVLFCEKFTPITSQSTYIIYQCYALLQVTIVIMHSPFTVYQ